MNEVDEWEKISGIFLWSDNDSNVCLCLINIPNKAVKHHICFFPKKLLRADKEKKLFSFKEIGIFFLTFKNALFDNRISLSNRDEV